MTKLNNLGKYILVISLLIHSANAQEHKKKLTAKRIEQAPKIDGILDETVWKDADVGTGFVVYEPNNGGTPDKENKTEVKVLYDDIGIYIGAMMHDKNPNTIPMEITPRDVRGQADAFSVEINTNNDGQNAVVFSVLSTGVQIDETIDITKKFNILDNSWNTVWFSGARVVKNGWVVEMKIPYAALRFPKTKKHLWGINFYRNMVAKNKILTWNHVDNTKGVITQYEGLLEGIENISPPIRLAFYPYVSTSSVVADDGSENNFNLGMDVKYGLTENFTLDMTLVPDFTQASFDRAVLNLGPFEQRFREQRQFFIEGTKLFNKGRMFYSRRIGGKPINFNFKKRNEKDKIIQNPQKINMLNAVKISGRTQKGLGIGFFNAITQKMEAKVESEDGTRYKVVTEPWANYNMLVLDQVFNKNSSVSLVNTNVTRLGKFRDANVTGLVYNLRTPNNKYYFNGTFRTSLINENETFTKGYNFSSVIGKDSGNWNYELVYYLEDDTFDINDMGFLMANNSQGVRGELSYRTLQPQGIFNFYRFTASTGVEYLYKPSVYGRNRSEVRALFFTNERVFFDGRIIYRGYAHDYFEPRKPIKEGWFFKRNPNWTFRHQLSTDYRKKFAVDYELGYQFFENEPQSAYAFAVSPRFRFSNAFTLAYSLENTYQKNNLGYVTKKNDAPIFGQRNVNNLENTLSGKYSFTVNTSLSIAFRYVWSTVKYHNQFYNLEKDGSLTSSSYQGQHNINYNNWNLDLNYIWQINPASQFLIFYRNNMFHRNKNAHLNFVENLQELLEQNNRHTFSVKLTYFVDYLDIKRIIPKFSM